MALMYPEKKGWTYNTRADFSKHPNSGPAVRCKNSECRHIFCLKDRNFCPKCGTFI